MSPARIPVVDVTVGSLEYGGVPRTIGLYETPASELKNLLHENILVRSGDAPVHHDPYVLLRHAAGRFD